MKEPFQIKNSKNTNSGKIVHKNHAKCKGDRELKESVEDQKKKKVDRRHQSVWKRKREEDIELAENNNER